MYTFLDIKQTYIVLDNCRRKKWIYIGQLLKWKKGELLMAWWRYTVITISFWR
jgi:hypothetical protein